MTTRVKRRKSPTNIYLDPAVKRWAIEHAKRKHGMKLSQFIEARLRRIRSGRKETQ